MVHRNIIAIARSVTTAAAMGVLFMPFGWIRKSKPQPPPQDAYSELRDRVLSIKPSDVGVTPTSGLPGILGVVMETGYRGAVVTLVSLADRTTSLYFSNGGGVVGAGKHAPVAAATAGFISLTNEFLNQLEQTTTFPLPETGRVRFYVLTDAGVLTAEADEQDLGNMRHNLSPLFHKGHEVIGNVRLTTDQQQN